MNRLVGGVMAGLLAVWAGTAMGAEIRGQIEAVDEAAKTITVDGETYKIGEGVAATELVPGEEVVISYEDEGGEKVINRIEAGEEQ
jgi:hypothetical protein